MIRRDDGFSTIELMITLAVAGILALVAANAFNAVTGAVGVNRARGAVDQLAEAIRQTRQVAITNAANHCIVIGGTAYTVRVAGGSCDGSIVDGPFTLTHGATATTRNFEFTPISTSVTPGTTTLISPTSVDVTADGVTNRICVNAAGAVVIAAAGTTCSTVT